MTDQQVRFFETQNLSLYFLSFLHSGSTQDYIPQQEISAEEKSSFSIQAAIIYQQGADIY